jgi:mono/diheme cytochrome c family protein
MKVAAVLLGACSFLWSAVFVLGCEPRDQTPLGRGARTFQRTCSGCHGADGRGGYRPGLVRPPRDLTRAEFHAATSDEQLRKVIRLGKNEMPAFGGLLADDDISNLITFIRSLPPQKQAGAPGSGGAVGSAAAPGASAAPGAGASAPTSALAPQGAVQK